MLLDEIDSELDHLVYDYFYELNWKKIKGL